MDEVRELKWKKAASKYGWDDDGYYHGENKRKFLLEKMLDYAKREKFNMFSWIPFAIQYETRWKKIKSGYNHVTLLGMEFIGVGETIPRLFKFIGDNSENLEKYYLHLPIFSPDRRGGCFNHGVFNVFREYCRFITPQNFSFWMYVFIFHSDDINLDEFNFYRRRIGKHMPKIAYGQPPICIPDDVMEHSRNALRNMEAGDKYICVHAREEMTKSKNNISVELGLMSTSVQDADLNTYWKACAYMENLGYKSIRMGKDEEKMCNLSGIIDYANKFYDEELDFSVPANCKFMIGCASGLSVITPFWGRPLLTTNALCLCCGYEWLPKTKYDLHIPKKYYSRRKGRLLNLHEVIAVSNRCLTYTENYLKEDIVLIDNTEDEILHAVMEINAKIDGTWEVSEAEKKCNDKYWLIMRSWERKHRQSYTNRYPYTMYEVPISYSYLKNNMYLLDVGEIDYD